MARELLKCAQLRALVALRVVALAGIVSVVGLVGCGHKASQAECEQIVERVTVLQVQKEQLITDPKRLGLEADFQKRVQHDTMMKKCVGKRITDSIMRCVREAKTADEIVNECFD
jgi:hypothetical protein